MVRPEQRVIIYREGIRGQSKKTRRNAEHDALKGTRFGYASCLKCKRPVCLLPDGRMRNHYSDAPNRIHCLLA